METESIVLEHLRAIRATQDRHTEMLLELKTRTGFLEQQYANLSSRVWIASTIAPIGSRSASGLSKPEHDADLSHNEAEEITPEWAAKGTDVLFHAVVETAEIVE